MTRFATDLDTSRSLYAAFVTPKASAQDLSTLAQLVAAMLRDSDHIVDGAGMADDGSARIALKDAMLRWRSNGHDLLELRLFVTECALEQDAAKALLADTVRMSLSVIDAEEICWGDSEARVDTATFRTIFGGEAPRRVAPRRVTTQVQPRKPHHQQKKVTAHSRTRKAGQVVQDHTTLSEAALRTHFLADGGKQGPGRSPLSRGLQLTALSGVILAMQSTAIAAKAADLLMP